MSYHHSDLSLKLKQNETSKEVSDIIPFLLMFEKQRSFYEWISIHKKTMIFKGLALMVLFMLRKIIILLQFIQNYIIYIETSIYIIFY